MAAEVLITLAILLVVVTLVGHGIWVLLALIFRAVMGPTRPTDHPPRPCPACGAAQAVVNGRCNKCGATPLIRSAPTMAAADENFIIIRRLEQLLAAGVISREEFEKLELLIQDEDAAITPSAGTTSVGGTDSPAIPAAAGGATEARDGGATPFGPAASGTGDEFVEIEIVEAEAIDEPIARPPATTRPLATHPLDRPEPPRAIPQASAPRRTLAALLQTFMEDKNIRWGEIISGLLIIVCAVGLVVSLWASLRDSIPYLPALIFMVGTAAFHAAGHYTLRSWKLASISRAVLIIATLLIPLNFLAAIALSGNSDQPSSPIDATYLTAVVVGLLAYGTMTYFAGRAFLRDEWWRLLAGVMGPCGGQLLINRLAHEGDSGLQVLLLLSLPLAGFLVATVSGLLGARRWQRLSLLRAEPLLLVLGIGTFSLLCAMALVIAKSPGVWEMLAQLSPSLSLMAGVILATGLMIHQHTTSAKLYALRMTGTSLSMGAACGLLICIVLAWPDPELLIAVGTLNAVLLASLGFLVSLPVLHGFAVACGGLAWLVGYHTLSGHYAQPPRGIDLVRSFLTGQTAAALGVFAALVGGVGAGLARARYARDARGYLLGAAATVAISALLATGVGFFDLPDSYLAPPTLALYAVAMSLAAWLVSDGRLTWAASAILLVALVQALGFVDDYQTAIAAQGLVVERPILFALLAHSFICLACGLAAGRMDAWRQPALLESKRWSTLVCPLTETALITSLLAAPSALAIWDFDFGFHAKCLGAIAVVWLGVAVVRRWPLVWMMAHAAATCWLAALVAAQRQVGSWPELFHPRHVAVTLLVLAAWCLLAVAARWLCRRWPDVNELLDVPSAPSVDRLTVGVLIAMLLGILAAGCQPGTLQELGAGKGTVLATTLAGHAQMFDLWMWAAWLAVTAALLLAIWERYSQLGVEALVLVALAVPLLLAGPYETQAASLSALRWTLATFGLVVAAGWSAREPLLKLLQRRSNWPGLDNPDAARESTNTIPLLLVGLSALPVVIATTLTVIQVVRGVTLGGPDADSWFARIGSAWSYGAPLALVATSLLVIAVRDARTSFAAGGSLVFQYLASLACLLPPLTAGRELTEVDTARLGQWNAVALGSYALVWLALRQWIEPAGTAASEAVPGPAPSPPVRWWLGIRGQVIAAVIAVALLAIAAAGGIVFSPGTIVVAIQQLGHWSSFLALLLAVSSVVWLLRGRIRDERGAHIVSGAGFCLAAFVAAATGPQNLSTNWLSFHVLLAGWTVVMMSGVVESWWPFAQPESELRRAGWPTRTETLIGWATAVGGLVAALSLFAALHDPSGPWWALGATLTVAFAAAAAAVRIRQQALCYASTILLAAAVTYFWLGSVLVTGTPELLQLAHWWILAVAVSSGCWLGLEVHSQQQHDRSFQAESRALPAHRFFAAVALLGLLSTTLLAAAIGSLQRGPLAGRQSVDPSTWWGLAAIVATGLLLIGLLWDRRARTTLFSLYAWGIAAQVMLIDAFQWRIDNTILAVAISVAAYVALTGALWRRGANLAALGLRWGISDPVAGLRRTATWLPTLNVLAGGFGLLCGLGLVLGHPDRPQRVMTAPIPALIAIGLACLAQSGRKQVFQFGSLVMLGISCVFLSWADIEPGLDGPAWLSRVIRLLMVCCAVSFACTMLVARRRDMSTDWQMSLKRVGLTAGLSALVVLAAVLLIEGLLYLDNPARGAPISDIQLAAVSVVMVGLVAALIAMAILPGRDPLGLSEQGRTCYVYAAQVAGALLFAHIYLTRPQWFGQWAPFWPYIILLIAFAGAGVGELFQRTGHRVLAEPLQRTGTFLPLLPAIGMWFIASTSDYSYSFYLFGAGILYVGLSIGRKSLASALAAVVAANGALWSMLDEKGFMLLSQPQLWLIPPALSVLIASEINRKRLPESALTGVRYACMMVIYLSSAGEIFIRGIGQTLWPPMVLLSLSLAGAMAGIVLRIRAFLYLGITFVLLSMITMVWHAARSINHVWPWWAFGIGLGLCILAFFGFFEKNREKITAMAERLKQWEP